MLKSQQREHKLMNVISTFIKRHPYALEPVDHLFLHITEEIIEYYISLSAPSPCIVGLPWLYIIENRRISREFIEKYKHNISKIRILAHPTTTLAEIQQYVMRPDEVTHDEWEWICKNPNLDGDFVAKYNHYLTECTTFHCVISLDYIKRHMNDDTIWYYAYNPRLTREFICEHIDKLNEHIHSHHNFYIEDHPSIDISWLSLSANPNLTPAFIRENWDQFDKLTLYQNRAFTTDMIKESSDNWVKMFYNPNMTIEMMEQWEQRHMRKDVCWVGTLGFMICVIAVAAIREWKRA
jgi:hypothetical protein